MDRKKFLLKRRIKYMITLFVTFLILLCTFDVVVFTVARNALYEECDSQLQDAREHIDENPSNAVENFSNGKSIVYYDDGSNYVINYKIFLLLRDESGEILNSEYLSAFDYMLNLSFDSGKTGYLATQKVSRNNEDLAYRTYIVSAVSDSGEQYYVQLATETSEIELSLSIIVRVLTICTCIAMVMVLFGGWALSRTLVGGIIEGWDRQDEFISYASHEIRSPLAVIHSSLELLLETPGEKIINRSDLILNSLTESSRLRKMTNNLLEMVRLQSSEIRLHREMIDMKQMVDDFIEPFVYMAEETGKVMKYHVEEDIVIAADRQLITELMVILLENALKYTVSGDLINLSIAHSGNNVVIKVSDSGVGISKESLTKIFSRFYRDESQQGKSTGSGLGLYIAVLIMQAHDGKIVAEQNKPKGTVFKATLPYRAYLEK